MGTIYVRDLMSRRVHTVAEDSNLDEALDLLKAEKIRHLPILSEDGALVGLVTQHDILRRAFGGGSELPASIQRAYLRTMPVQEVMTRELMTVGPDRSIQDAALLLMEGRLGCLPVVEGGRLIGIVTVIDFLRHVVES